MASESCEENGDCVEKRIPAPEPTHIFKVENGKRDAKWKELEGRLQTQIRHFGFHGSRPENFFSILSRGLQQHLNKVRFIKIWQNILLSDAVVRQQFSKDIFNVTGITVRLWHLPLNGPRHEPRLQQDWNGMG